MIVGKAKEKRANKIGLFPSILSLSLLPARFLPVGEIPGLLGPKAGLLGVAVT